MSEALSVIMPVYEDGERAAVAIRALLSVELPPGMSLEIVVVDDGSRDNSAEFITRMSERRINFVELSENRGRAGACNEGVRRAVADFLVFVDSDFLPETDRFLRTHYEALRAGAVASVGHVFGFGGGFWDRYQREASWRRERQFQQGITYAGNSNLAVRKSSFEEVGGYDVGYRRYGFEDRDLLIRLSRVGAIAWTPGATVRHLDELALGKVCRKMAEAGQWSSGRFAERHPAAYRDLGYAAVDCRRRGWLKPIARLFGPGMPRFADRLESVLHRRWIPYPLRKGVVKLASALSFMYGTRLAAG